MDKSNERCGTNTCVDVVRDGDQFLVRSTRRPEMTPVRFDADEWAKFGREVADGTWDGTFRAAREIEARTATV